MVVGFTGSRVGMTPYQRERVRAIMTDLVEEAHHGDCVGADADFHEICMELGIEVVLHPPDREKYRAFSTGYGRELDPLPYLRRNRAIVQSSSLLIACPKESREPAPARGQGTWSTVRFARKMDVRVAVIYPSPES